jgi:replicative superfamily II helicase
VTTPEKFDVTTRKGTSMFESIHLVILDEVHLLNDERGSVIENLVARLFRTVERTQRKIRLVGLSATLPNYLDVADFLQVDVERGLFHFGSEYRPVPLAITFIGIKDPKDPSNNLNRKKKPI